MADFSEIPKGIAREIAAEHLDDLDDVENFGKVCSLWRSEIKGVDYTNFRPSKNTQLPWLMLADSPNTPYRRFYSLSKGMFLKIDLPRYDADPLDNRKYLSSKGWLIAVSMKRALFTFYDPFTGSIINPPNIPVTDFTEGLDWEDYYYEYQFNKFIFSCRPSSSSPSHDFQVAIIFDTLRHLAFWRPGQQRWIQPETDQLFSNRQVEDVCFFRGQIYAINMYTQVVTFVNNRPQILANLTSIGVDLDAGQYKYYIIGSRTSTLLVIQRDIYRSETGKEYYTGCFKLYEVNLENGNLAQVRDIGNRALFIGQNSTFFVEASGLDGRGCRPNSIYFTDDYYDFFIANKHLGGGGIDMGIYSLEENKVVDLVYKGPSQFCFVNPPQWVELPHRSLERCH